MLSSSRTAVTSSGIRKLSTFARLFSGQSLALSAGPNVSGSGRSSILLSQNGRRALCLCSKLASSSVEDVKVDAQQQVKGAETQFKVPQHPPTKLDRFTLIFTRTMKAEDIGSEVSHDTMQKANTKRRIMVNMLLMVFTLFGSIYYIRKGKKDSKTDNIYKINERR